MVVYARGGRYVGIRSPRIREAIKRYETTKTKQRRSRSRGGKRLARGGKLSGVVSPEVAKAIAEREAKAEELAAYEAAVPKKGVAGRKWEQTKERLIPHYKTDKASFKGEMGREVLTSQQRAEFATKYYADVRRKQAEKKLLAQKLQAEGRIKARVEQFQPAVSAGVMSRSGAMGALGAFVSSEEVKLSDASAIAEKAFGEETKAFGETRWKQEETRLQKRIGEKTFGLGGEYGLDLFAIRTIPGYERLHRGLAKQSKAMGEYLKAPKSAKLRQEGHPVIAEAIERYEPTPTRKTTLDITRGVLRRPVTTLGIGAVTGTLTFGTALATPAIVSRALKGGKIARNILRGGRAAKIGLPLLFAGERTYRIATAPSSEEGSMRMGETFAFLGGGIAGSVGGAKVAEKLLGLRPTLIKGKASQRLIGKDTYEIRTTGKIMKGGLIRRKKLQEIFPFEKRIVSMRKGHTILEKGYVKYKAPFGKKWITKEIGFKGAIQEPAAQGARLGVAQWVKGKYKIGKKVIPADFTAYRSGEVIGRTGRWGVFKTKSYYTGGKRVMKFDVNELLDIKFPKLPKLGKKAQIGAIPRGGRIGLPRPQTGAMFVPRTFPGTTSLFTARPLTYAGISSLTLPIYKSLIISPFLARGKALSLSRGKIGTDFGIQGLQVPKIGYEALSPYQAVPSVGFPSVARGSGITTTFSFPALPALFPPTITPAYPFLFPQLPRLGAYRGAGRIGKGKKRKRKLRYQPSLGALIFGTRGKQPSFLTGLERRPLTGFNMKRALRGSA